MQIISGNTTPTEGEIHYEQNGARIEDGEIFRQIAIAAPYLELLEEFTLDEMIRFHFQFKKIIGGIKIEQISQLMGLENASAKQIRQFSSGMKQRVKLGLTILSDVPVLLLDEPASNLDHKAIDWYNDLIKQYSSNRIVIVCSNQQKNEFEFCGKNINIEDHKGVKI